MGMGMIIDSVKISKMLSHRSNISSFPQKLVHPDYALRLAAMKTHARDAEYSTSASSAEALMKEMTVRDVSALESREVDSGDCLVFLETVMTCQASRCDLTCQASRCELSVRAWAESECGQLVGKVAEWPAKHASNCPSWYTACSLGFPLGTDAASILNIELCDKLDVIGSLKVPFLGLPGHLCVTRDFEMRQPKPGDRACSVCFQIVDAREILKKRTVYFIRHGDSCWNKAQSKSNFYEIERQTDHPLPGEGRKQAETLSATIEKERGLALPRRVYVSPLTRAIPAAVIGLRKVLDQPSFGELVLMANAREKQNLGGFDSKPQKIGSDVINRALDELVFLYQDEQAQQGVKHRVEDFEKLKFDTRKVEDRWWINVSAESDQQLEARLDEFMAQLKYSPHRTIVVIGHSQFFRAIFKKFLPEGFKVERSSFAKELSTKKLPNCGVARLELDPGITSGECIADVEIILETELIGEEGLCRSGAGSTQQPKDDQPGPQQLNDDQTFILDVRPHLIDDQTEDESPHIFPPLVFSVLCMVYILYLAHFSGPFFSFFVGLLTRVFLVQLFLLAVCVSVLCVSVCVWVLWRLVFCPRSPSELESEVVARPSTE
jgi:broad specificity phosphatase PhoE